MVGLKALATSIHAEPMHQVPLCVDLDGTLVSSDTLFESCARLLATRPQRALMLPVWLSRGRAAFKEAIARNVELDPAGLPYHRKLLERLRRERQAGRRIVLVTAADRAVATRIAEHLGLFDEIVASDGRLNLKGSTKRDVLVARFGEGGFDYAGDARADLPVFRAARTAIVVNAGAGVSAASPAEADRSLAARPSRVLAFVRALRPHQWLKNLLVFLPLLLSHRLSDSGAWWRDAVAFAALSCAASAVYLSNDLLDLESDRAHRSKHRRALASGDLPLSVAFVAAPLLAIVAVVVAWGVSAQLAVVVAGYLALSLAYSLWFKEVVLLDVVVLAALYAARLLAGSVAAHVLASFWLLAFALFMFVSLATLKRYSELVGLREATAGALGRDYALADAPLIAAFGIASGYVAVLVVALYIHGDQVRSLYAHPSLLWLLCPILLYWISRAWLIAHRGAMHDDPILFALGDRASLVVAVLCLLVGLTASLRLPLPAPF